MHLPSLGCAQAEGALAAGHLTETSNVRNTATCNLPDFPCLRCPNVRALLDIFTDHPHLDYYSPTYTPWVIAAAKRKAEVEAVDVFPEAEEEATSKAKGGHWET